MAVHNLLVDGFWYSCMVTWLHLHQLPVWGCLLTSAAASQCSLFRPKFGIIPCQKLFCALCRTNVGTVHVVINYTHIFKVTCIFNKFNGRSVHLTCSKGVSSDVWQSGKGWKQLEQKGAVYCTQNFIVHFIVHSIVHSSRAIYTSTICMPIRVHGSRVLGSPVPGPRVHWI